MTDSRGRLDTTLRSWSSTFAARVLLVIQRLLLVAALPLDFLMGDYVSFATCSSVAHCVVSRLLFSLKAAS